MTRVTKSDVLRVASIVTGCIGMAAAGASLAFNAFSNAIKLKFDYSQSQVETMASSIILGLCIGLPAGLVFEKLGARWTSFTSLLLTVVGYIMLYTTCDHIEFYHNHPFLQNLYFFITGFGGVWLYMSCLSTNICNVSPQYRGTIIGLLDSCYSSGPAITALIYGELFVKGHVQEAGKQDLKGFYFACAICCSCICLCGVIFIQIYPTQNPIEEEPDKLPLNFTESVESSGNEFQNSPLKKLMRSFDFHFIFWSFVMCSSVQMMYINNITTYLRSFHHQNKSTIFTVLNPTASTVAKFLVGFTSDRIVERVPRVLFVMLLTVLQTTVLILSIVWGDHYPIIFLTVMGIGLSYGATWCLTPTMISEYFGVKHFAGNWGFMMVGAGVGCVVLQKIMGLLYDAEIGDAHLTDCYGLRCFRFSFITIAVLGLCSIILYMGLFERHIQNKKDADEIRKRISYIPRENSNDPDDIY